MDHVQLRWFLPTADSRLRLLDDWLQDSTVARVIDRQHYYRATEALPFDLNIDWGREPRVTISWRSRVAGLPRNTTELSGVVEHRREAHMGVDERLLVGIDGNPEWVGVSLVRRTRQFRFGGQDSRCVVDLSYVHTDISAAHAQAYTFGLTATGPAMLDALEGTCRRIKEGSPNLRMTPEQSMGLSDWLRQSATWDIHPPSACPPLVRRISGAGAHAWALGRSLIDLEPV